MSEERSKELAEEEKVRNLVEQMVSSVKDVPEFVPIAGYNEDVHRTLCQVAMAGVSGRCLTTPESPHTAVLSNHIDKFRRSRAW